MSLYKTRRASNHVPIEIFVSVKVKPAENVGAWGAEIFQGNQSRVISGSARSKDYNRLHLLGIVKAFAEISRKSRVTIYSRNRYVLAGVGNLPACKTRRWRTSSFRIIRNEDLWRQLDKCLRKHEVSWRW